MRSTLLGVLILLAPSFATGADPDPKATAQEILDKGSALFDKRDAAAITATYRNEAEIHLITRAKDSTEVKIEVKRGRAEIESGYGDVFKDRKPETKSKNTVEYATFLAPDILLIEGKFQLDLDNDLTVRFVQMRVKIDGRWLIQRLELFYIEG